MLPVIAALVFAGAAAAAIGVIVGMIAPQWRRIARLASGQIEPPIEPPTEADHWYEVHLAADRREFYTGPAHHG